MFHELSSDSSSLVSHNATFCEEVTKCVYITLSSSLFVSFTFSKDTTWKWRIIKQLRVDDDDGNDDDNDNDTWDDNDDYGA